MQTGKALGNRMMNDSLAGLVEKEGPRRESLVQGHRQGSVARPPALVGIAGVLR